MYRLYITQATKVVNHHPVVQVEVPCARSYHVGQVTTPGLISIVNDLPLRFVMRQKHERPEKRRAVQDIDKD